MTKKTKMYVKEDFNIVAPTISTIIVNEFEKDIKYFNNKLSNEENKEKQDSIKKIIETMEKRKRAGGRLKYAKTILEFLTPYIINDTILEKMD